MYNMDCRECPSLCESAVRVLACVHQLCAAVHLYDWANSLLGETIQRNNTQRRPNTKVSNKTVTANGFIIRQQMLFSSSLSPADSRLTFGTIGVFIFGGLARGTICRLIDRGIIKTELRIRDLVYF